MAEQWEGEHGYAPKNHDHDSRYSKLGHTHDGIGELPAHNHDTVYSKLGHSHDDKYSKLGHVHNYAASDHNHDDRYSLLDHSHELLDMLPIGTVLWFKSNVTLSNKWTVYTDLIGRYPLGSTSNLGGTVRDGLPEIYGVFGTDAAYGDETEGAFTVITEGSTYGSGGAEGRLFAFTASNGTKDVNGNYMSPSASPYGKANVVTPPSVNLIPYIKIA